jgi:hypothetical protein
MHGGVGAGSRPVRPVPASPEEPTRWWDGDGSSTIAGEGSALGGGRPASTLSGCRCSELAPGHFGICREKS